MDPEQITQAPLKLTTVPSKTTLLSKPTFKPTTEMTLVPILTLDSMNTEFSEPNHFGLTIVDSEDCGQQEYNSGIYMLQLLPIFRY